MRVKVTRVNVEDARVDLQLVVAETPDKATIPYKINKIVVYPNSGAVYHAETKTWTRLAEKSSCEIMVKEWMDLGADMIGGCCGIGPEQIKAMGKMISQ